ncbi:acid-sensing ion channel 5 [Drosophila obscura]|uniref:acid-sensing ion channel 5 n=1 Tax=Drosophila obscura TaxID=7282 RepID=UPI001BB123CE|nr:acid-sensing ion channel 5 [Drosophila obscura]
MPIWMQNVETLPLRLVVGRAAWWIPHPGAKPPQCHCKSTRHAPVTVTVTLTNTVMAAATSAEDTRKLPFAAALKDFLENLSFHCYGKLVEHGRRIQERFFWLIFHITALSVLIAFLWGTCMNEIEEALVTTMYHPLYPIWKVQFPAISVCSFNRISERAVWRYAQELSIKDPKQRGVSVWYEQLKDFLPSFYIPHETRDIDRAMRFQSFLDRFDVEANELFFNTRRRMHLLTPNCSDMFVSCRIAGRTIDCVQQFEESLTSHGYCCTFNHDGRYVNKRDFRQRYFGPEMGLVLTLKTMPSDHFYPVNPHMGFRPHSYPDPFSGGVAERMAKTGVNTLLPVRAKIFETVPEARRMSKSVRKCLFEDEMPWIFTRRYTFSKCISACRARSVVSLCECVPFTLPHRYIDGIEKRLYCTLQHNECLKRYEFKWLNVITSRENVTGLEHEMQDALYCPQCLASCTETRYSVRGAMTLALPGTSKSPPRSSLGPTANNSYGNANSNSSSQTELAVVRIYFAETHIQYFRQIIKSAWYETFSTIGNICGIIAGFSLIGICELLFFLAKQLWQACKAELRAELAHIQFRKEHQHPTRGTGRQHQPAATAGAAGEQERPMELFILP